MQVQKPLFFIGYDSKEDIAYRVCKQSLLKNSSINIKVVALKLYELIAKGFYKRSADPLGPWCNCPVRRTPSARPRESHGHAATRWKRGGRETRTFARHAASP